MRWLNHWIINRSLSLLRIWAHTYNSFSSFFSFSFEEDIFLKLIHPIWLLNINTVHESDLSLKMLLLSIRLPIWVNIESNWWTMFEKSKRKHRRSASNLKSQSDWKWFWGNFVWWLAGPVPITFVLFSWLFLRCSTSQKENPNFIKMKFHSHLVNEGSRKSHLHMNGRRFSPPTLVWKIAT